MKKLWQSLLDPIRQGEQYRLEQYGPPDTFHESFVRARKIHQNYRANNLAKCLPMMARSRDLANIDRFKMKFQYWDEWTGSRYVRRENPYLAISDLTKNRVLTHFPEINIGTICRPNHVTGYWETVNDRNYH